MFNTKLLSCIFEKYPNFTIGQLQYLNKQEWHDGKERPDRHGGCILICNHGNHSLSFFNHSSNMFVNGHYWPTKWKYLFK